MISRSLVTVLAAYFWLIPALAEENRWSALDLNKELQEGEDDPALDPYHKASLRASFLLAQQKNREDRALKLVRSYNEKTKQSFSNIDLGVVTDLPEVKLSIHGHLHYFFEGRDVPQQLGENIIMTFNISAGGEGGSYFMRRLEAVIWTNKASLYRPRTDGMGTLDDDKWSFTFLVIMDEKSVRRLLEEELGVLDLGLVTVTRKDWIVQGLEMLLADMDERRKTRK